MTAGCRQITLSSASYDLHHKLRTYRRNGVREHVIWPVDDTAIDWLRLREEVDERVEPDDRLPFFSLQPPVDCIQWPRSTNGRRT